MKLFLCQRLEFIWRIAWGDVLRAVPKGFGLSKLRRNDGYRYLEGIKTLDACLRRHDVD